MYLLSSGFMNQSINKTTAFSCRNVRKAELTKITFLKSHYEKKNAEHFLNVV